MVKTESPAEQRMILHHVSWETYQRLLCDYEDSSALRFTYDQGTLEIMTPQIEHEGFNRFIQLLLIAVEEVTGTELYNYGSTTLSREDLQKGLRRIPASTSRTSIRSGARRGWICTSTRRPIWWWRSTSPMRP